MKRFLMLVVFALVAATAYGAGPEGSRIVGVRGDPPRGDATILLMRDSDTTGVVMREGGVTGAMSISEAGKDRDLRVYYANIINNYSARTAPGGADSSVAYSLGGANKAAIRFYSLTHDSATYVRYQILYVQVRYGDGSTTDSTGHFPQATRRISTAANTPDSVAIVPVLPDGAASLSSPLYPQAGEFVVKAPAYDKLGQRYVSIGLPDPPVGALYVSVRVRVGPIIYANDAPSIASKWTAAYRVDFIGGR